MSDKNTQPTFFSLGVAVEITHALFEMGITHTFAIQELTLPIALEGRDLIGQARTGMGKTYGFGVPLLDRVFDSADIEELDGTCRALVVVPTRELAVQVGDDLARAAKYTPIQVRTIYGGRPIEEQTQLLKSGADVVVGTPGRLLDLYHRNILALDRVAILVLDEADEMLDLGFFPDVEKLMSALTHEHQTMLFSATMPGAVLSLARTFLHQPVHIRAEQTDTSATHASTQQIVFASHRMDKPSCIARILQAKDRGRTIIFTRTKRSAAELAEDLAARGFSVGAVHGDLNQQAREASLEAFRAQAIDILVATDVAARGIDIDDVTHVINYQTPDDPMTYVHRIGRTGRAGHSGTAVTLVGYDELNKWKNIDDELELGIGEPPQWFSTSPELFAALNIPDDATDQVGSAKRVFGARISARSMGNRGSSRGQRSARSGRVGKAGRAQRSSGREQSSRSRHRSRPTQRFQD
ncbi:DEAD/DEAH box helicase [Corynebacterium felinum]|uniref:Superfamily II DNA/RNA helicase n=1 Tax=Corynebacterium felinum TaxID=131318 RepID=A0ABU2B8K7_9CORY|nr:DEAD/DEAH box helicase [Corynebacterium felinum]MDF5821077.1 DEAD/DEAH box helicase [Corynebacterium felinum]MDR7354942.1 superfamily II DNA/RNA helicase [Corynebacterium felinum]